MKDFKVASIGYDITGPQLTAEIEACKTGQAIAHLVTMLWGYASAGERKGALQTY